MAGIGFERRSDEPELALQLGIDRWQALEDHAVVRRHEGLGQNPALGGGSGKP
jgi:hypothetical protein